MRTIKFTAALLVLFAALVASTSAAAKVESEQGCLAEAVYYEARGETVAGWLAVAEVILHRLKSGNHGRTICSVVYQGVSRHACQFSFACDGSQLHRKSAREWRRARDMAAQILSGDIHLANETEGALFYHASYVKPRWAHGMMRTAEIGKHIFYRPADDPFAYEAPVLRLSLW